MQQKNSEEEVVDSIESADFKPEQALNKEKTLFERFSGKAKKIARVMTLVSALSAAPGLVQEAYAEQKSPDVKVKQVEKESINEANVTESGKWAKEILDQAKSELSEVKTREDAIHFINSNAGSFMRECYFPTKGNIRQAELVPTLTLRKYSVDDLRLIAQVAEQLKTILQDLDSKYSMGGTIDKVKTNLDDIDKKASSETLYSSRKQADASSGYIILRH